MRKIVPIVEGPGDVTAVPILLKRLLIEMGRNDISAEDPQNAHGCGNLTKLGGIERFVENAWMKRDCRAVLVLVDADKECPIQIAHDFVSRIRVMGVRFPVVIVVAKREYEAWFLASLETFAGVPLEGGDSLPVGLIYSGEVEDRTGAKR